MGFKQAWGQIAGSKDIVDRIKDLVAILQELALFSKEFDIQLSCFEPNIVVGKRWFPFPGTGKNQLGIFCLKPINIKDYFVRVIREFSLKTSLLNKHGDFVWKGLELGYVYLEFGFEIVETMALETNI